MSRDQEVMNLEQLLDRIGKATQDDDRVSLGAVLDVVDADRSVPYCSWQVW